MTQENKLEWVKELIQELIEVCNEQEVTLTLQATSKENNFSASAVCGVAKEVGLNLLLLETNIEEDTGKSVESIKRAGAETVCDCPRCTAKRENRSMNSEKIPDDVLSKFLGSLFDIAERSE